MAGSPGWGFCALQASTIHSYACNYWQGQVFAPFNPASAEVDAIVAAERSLIAVWP
jgi:hypothetical protein